MMNNWTTFHANLNQTSSDFFILFFENALGFWLYLDCLPIFLKDRLLFFVCLYILHDNGTSSSTQAANHTLRKIQTHRTLSVSIFCNDWASIDSMCMLVLWWLHLSFYYILFIIIYHPFCSIWSLSTCQSVCFLPSLMCSPKKYPPILNSSPACRFSCHSLAPYSYRSNCYRSPFRSLTCPIDRFHCPLHKLYYNHIYP